MAAASPPGFYRRGRKVSNLWSVYLKPKIRAAVESDKEPVLDFCKNTFSWGDYIDRAWDTWFSDLEGKLLVSVDSENLPIGIAHAALCPGKSLWLEGLRIKPEHRKTGHATALVQSMLDFGFEKGASEALGIVAQSNLASRQMLQKFGFAGVSDWNYFSIEGTISMPRSDSRLARRIDIDEILAYLDTSKIFKLSAQRYMNVWRWYRIDRQVLKDFIDRERLVVDGNPIRGIALLNTDGYWNRHDILQVVYLDADSASLGRLIGFAANLQQSCNLQRMQILCHSSLSPYIKQIAPAESEHFILYAKEF